MIKRIKKILSLGKNENLEYYSKEKPDAIILSAGMMGRKTLFPKALLEYGGKTAIEHQINWLKPFVKKIIIACHKKECEQIAKHIGKIEGVEFSNELQLLGTAGATKKAISKSKANNFIVCNVDDLTDIDLNALIDFGADTMCVANPRLNFGVLETDGFDVRQYREKPVMRNVWANCGIYLLSRKTIEKLPDKGSLEHDVWPYIRMKAFKHFGMWKTFGK
ncbi:MAG: sugar phosphate nucleotidyltransferase [Candidatus Pacearchaeota archaeon]